MMAADVQEAVADACAAYQSQAARFRYEPLVVTATLAGPLAVFQSLRRDDERSDGAVSKSGRRVQPVSIPQAG